MDCSTSQYLMCDVLGTSGLTPFQGKVKYLACFADLLHGANFHTTQKSISVIFYNILINSLCDFNSPRG